MINADMLEEQNNIIGHDLANELSSNKMFTWGLKVCNIFVRQQLWLISCVILQIFEINKNVGLWTDLKKHSNNVESTIKYVALSAYDQRDEKYLGLFRSFVSPASITYNITDTVDTHDEEYTINVPATGSQEIEFDKAVLGFRIDMMEVGAIFTTIKNPSRVLLVRRHYYFTNTRNVFYFVYQ